MNPRTARRHARALPLSWHFFGELNAFYAATTGIVAGILVGIITEYYTSSKYRPTQQIAEAAQTGAGTNLIEGLAVGMQSVILPGIVIVAALLVSVWASGPYGVTLAAVGMLATVAITMAVDTFGAVADNAGGIAEMAGLPAAVRKRTDALDALGNTTAAIGKGFSIAASAFVALALFSESAVLSDLGATSMTDIHVIAGVLIGAMVPFLFSSFCMRAVSRAAFVIIEEVRRQFKTKKILEGKDKPDYGACVDIATKGALREMIAPGVLVVVTPVLVGFLLGPAALGGMLLGAVASGVLLALMMANAGGAWYRSERSRHLQQLAERYRVCEHPGNHAANSTALGPADRWTGGLGLRQRPGYELAKTSAAVVAETAFLNQRSSVAGSSHDRIWSRRLGLSFTPRASSSISTLSALPADFPSRMPSSLPSSLPSRMPLR